MEKRFTFILALALLVLLPLAEAQDDEASLPIQQAPGVEKLAEDERAIVTLRTWGGIWEPVTFEVLPLQGAPNAEPIMQGVTNGEGLARVELPRSEIADWDDSRGIHVRVAQSGFQSRLGGQRTRRFMGEQNQQVGLPVVRGTTAFVEVVDEAGLPAPAGLRWRIAGDPFSVGDPRASTKAYGDGWYQLHFSEDVCLDLYAEHPHYLGGKAGSLFGVRLKAGEEPQVLRITLRGDGGLQGVVRPHEGALARPMVVEAHWAGPLDPKELHVICSKPLDDWELQSRGIIRASIATDRDGRFRTGGLRPGFYKFACQGKWVIPEGTDGFVRVGGGGAPVSEVSLVITEDPRPDIFRRSYPKIRLLDPVSWTPEHEDHGLLEVNAVGQGGEAWGRFDITVVHAESGEMVDGVEFLDSRFVAEVPAGSYRIVVEGAPRFTRNCFGARISYMSRKYGRAKKTVEVLAGKHNLKTVEVELGGFIAIDFRGAVNSKDRMAVLQTLSGDPSYLSDRVQESCQPKVHLNGSGAPNGALHWQLPPGVRNPWISDFWPLNETRTSGCLPTGTFELVARLPGGRSARSQVTIASGETTPVTLRFAD